MGYDGHPFLDQDKFVDFERGLWFELVKFICRKHRSVYQYHMKYIHNDILKPSKVKTLRHVNRVREMCDLAKYLPPYLMKGESARVDNLTIRNQEFMVSEIWLAIKYGLTSSMQDELEEHQQD